MTRIRKTVTMVIEYESDAYVKDVKEYIIDHLGSSGGIRDPGDPLFWGVEVTNLKFKPLHTVPMEEPTK